MNEWTETKGKKPIPDDKFVWVRSIFGKGADAKKRYHHIPEGGVNEQIKLWHGAQDDRVIRCASPSQLVRCPRSVWLEFNEFPHLYEMGWGMKQRMLLGRLAENLFADQFADNGILVKHWQDDPGIEVEKFSVGEGDDYIEGVPDYMLKLDDTIVVSDAKTSRSDSFGYNPIEFEEITKDFNWYKYKVQLDAYFYLLIENKARLKEMNLPVPTHSHLFSYALDDGVVRREYLWETTEQDLKTVKRLIRIQNQAIKSKTIPDCTCGEDEMKFCKYAVIAPGKKVGESCCDIEITNKEK